MSECLWLFNFNDLFDLKIGKVEKSFKKQKLFKMCKNMTRNQFSCPECMKEGLLNKMNFDLSKIL